MDHFVTMETFPDGLQFPAILADRIHYDPQTRQLHFRGFMSKAEFDLLQDLSENWTYRRQLEELFRLCAVEQPEPPSRIRSWFRLRPSRTA